MPTTRTPPRGPAPVPALPASRHGATPPVLLVVAHGSRDPRHAACVRELTARVRALRPGLTVETGFLDFCVPGVPAVLSRLHARGQRHVVALPLLLGRAFHATADIPAVLAEQAARLPGLSVVQAGVLGPDPLLLAALERRLTGAGLHPSDRADTAVVLASAGSRDPQARAASRDLARAWERSGGWRAVRPAFAAAAPPRTADAVRALRAEGARRIAVAPYVIAPGLLPDRIAAGAREAGADLLAPVLGPAGELARVLVRRYEEACTRRTALRAG